MKKQAGFTVVEGLLVLIAVTLTSFVGYYVYRTQNQASTTYNASTADASSNTPKSHTKKTADSFTTCAKKNGAGLVSQSSGPYSQVLSCIDGNKTYTAKPYPSIQLRAADSKQVAWNDLPKDLQAFIQQSWPADCSGPQQSPREVLTEHLTPFALVGNDGYALNPLTCQDGSAHLLVKTAGGWKDVAHTQSEFSCTLLQQYNVPKSFAGPDPARCYDFENIERTITS